MVCFETLQLEFDFIRICFTGYTIYVCSQSILLSLLLDFSMGILKKTYSILCAMNPPTLRLFFFIFEKLHKMVDFFCKFY